MTSWAKDATKFTVSVTKNIKCKTSYSYIPKPVLDRLGYPRYLKFKFDGSTIMVEVGTK